MAGHQRLLTFTSLILQNETDLFKIKSLRRHIHNCGIPFLFCPWRSQKRAIRHLGNSLPWGNSQIAEMCQNHLSATWPQVFSLAKSHCGLAWGVIVPGVLPCIEVSSHHVSQRDCGWLSLGDKAWSCLGLLFRCWNNHVSGKWNGSI